MDSALLILLAGVIAFGLFVVFVFGYIHSRSSRLNKSYYQGKWVEIESNSKHEVGWTSAIVDADKLLDDALKKLNYKGKTMGERLASASRAFTNLDSVWAAHKLRNRVVHESSIKIQQKHVDSAMRSFKKALKDLGAV